MHLHITMIILGFIKKQYTCISRGQTVQQFCTSLCWEDCPRKVSPRTRRQIVMHPLAKSGHLKSEMTAGFVEPSKAHTG